MRFFSVRRPLVHARLSGFILLLSIIIAGCQSTKETYRFQVAPSLTTTPAETLAAAPADTNVNQTPSLVVRGATGSALPAARPLRGLVRVRHQVGRAVALPSAKLFPVTEKATQAVCSRPASPHATTEVGLGTTVFGVLGLLAVPIGLIGLVLGGGLVWGALVALGALAVLIAWLDPFG